MRAAAAAASQPACPPPITMTSKDVFIMERVIQKACETFHEFTHSSKPEFDRICEDGDRLAYKQREGFVTDINDRLASLGRIYKAQFNYLATAEPDNLSTRRDLQQYAMRALMVREDLAKAFGLTRTTPERDLENIVTQAEKRGHDASVVKEALGQLREIDALLSGHDASNADARNAARKVLGMAPV
jgi:hypothetical protein